VDVNEREIEEINTVRTAGLNNWFIVAVLNGLFP
jgi:hypothetical protein